jgi:hypothetical protein
MNTIRLTAYALFMGLFLAASVNADVIQYSADFGSAGSPLIIPGGFPTTLSLNKFNPSFGNLTSIQVFLDSSSSITLRVRNFNESSAIYTDAYGSATITMTAQTLDSLTTDATPSIVVPTDVAIQNGGSLAAFPEEGYTHFYNAHEDSDSSSVLVDSANFANYISSGPGDLTFDISVGASVSAGYTGDFDISANVINAPSYGTVTVEYTYTVVPEPATALIFLSGAGMLLMRRRFRR